MKLPCPRCGSEDTVGTFCVKCLRELNPLLKTIKEPKLTFCVISGDIKIKNSWESLTSKDAIKKSIEENIIFNTESTIERISYVFPELPDFSKPGLKKELLIKVIITGRVSSEMKNYDETYEIPVRIETTVSPRYAKIGSQYFEGVFQARNEQEFHKKALYNLIQKQSNKGQAINKEERVSNGTDYYIVKKKLFTSLVQELHEKFGGYYNMTRTLFSRDKQRSKDIYRVTWLLEYPPFSRKDVVIDDKKRILLVKDLGKKLRFENLMTGKNVYETYKKNIFNILSTVQTTVSQVYPKIMVIDPETYQPIILRNRLLPILKLGEKIDIIILDKKAWFVKKSK